MILRHAYEGLFPIEACTKSVWEKYLALKRWYINESYIFLEPPSLLSKRGKVKWARLNWFNWWDPIPLPTLGSQSLSQLSQTIFLSSCFWPHQNLRIILVKSSQREFGSLKQLMVYVGIAWATTLINTSLPAFERSFSFHPANFLLRFSLISLKEYLLFLPTRDVNPRYFSCCRITCALNLFLISSWISQGVLQLKNKEVLNLFNCCLEACS